MTTMTRKYISKCILIILVCMLITGLTANCTIYRLKVPKADGKTVSAFVMYPLGKKIQEPYLRIEKDEAGNIIGIELGAKGSEQPSLLDYAQGVSAGLNAGRGIPIPQAPVVINVPAGVPDG